MLNLARPITAAADMFLAEAEQRFEMDAPTRLFMEKAVEATARRDLMLSFATFDELLDVFESNRDTWPSLPPLFDTRLNRLREDETFCFLGRDLDGRVVASQAARIYRWSDSSFYDEATSLRMWADDPSPLRDMGMTCEISAETAHEVRGRVLYSGAAWYAPSYRKKQLTAILPRIARSLSNARWRSDFAVSLQAEKIARSGVAERVGFRHVDWAVDLVTPQYGAIKFAFVWIDAASMAFDMIKFASDFDVDGLAATERRRA